MEMVQLSESLQFYVKHAADVGALWAEDEKPDGVAPAEWEIFREVLVELKNDAEALLRRLFGPLEAPGQIKGFVATGRKAYKVWEYWDYRRQFKKAAKGNRGPVGSVGVQVVDEPGGASFLVVYVSASNPGTPMVGDDACPPQVKSLLSDKLVLASLQLAPDVPEEQLADLVKGAVPKIVSALESIV